MLDEIYDCWSLQRKPDMAIIQKLLTTVRTTFYKDRDYVKNKKS